MVVLVFLMLVCVVLGLAVVGLVAVPARRAGREMLTPRGEQVVGMVRGRTGTIASATRDRTGDLLNASRHRLGDAAGRRAG